MFVEACGLAWKLVARDHFGVLIIIWFLFCLLVVVLFSGCWWVG